MVTNSSVVVRRASIDDVPALLVLSEQPREALAVRRRGGVGVLSLAERYTALVEDPTRRVLIATGPDGDVWGMVILVLDWTGDLLDVPAVQASHLFVDDERRRRGVGRALLSAAAGYAEDLGCEHVVVGAAPTSRETNRYYARLGFAPVVTRRVASVAALRRSLGSTDATAVEVGRGQSARRRAVRITGSLTAGLGRRPGREAVRGAQ